MAEFSCDGSIGDWLESLTGRSDGSVTRAPIDDIEDWSKTQSPWRQDCLRRLATSDDLSEQDHAELLAIIRASVGLPVTAHPPVPIPFTKAHYSGERQKPIVLKGIANVDGVNRLMPKASLNFCPTALTVIYGRNGSGKSGFVRILRTACRTRISNPAKLKVLADVYGDGGGIQTADILIDDGSGDAIVKWTPGQAANPQLMQVSVFDSSSAQLYVDQGNQIHFLPFGLALLHRLNSVCLLFKTKLEVERSAEVTGKADLAVVAFPVQRDTAAQRFNRMLNKDTSDADILDQAGFPPADQERLDAISTALAAGAAAIADLDALAKWMRAVARECEIAVATLSDPALDALLQLKARATKARLAARTSAAELFSDDPLPGVGSETWHTLWKAARNFSLSEAYVGREFPVTDVDGEGASCVLCQQPLQQDGAERLRRFQKYVDDTLDAAATAAEQAVADAQAGLPALLHLMTDDFVDHLGQLRGRDLGLGDALAVFQSAAVARREDAEARLAGSSGEELAEIVALHAELNNLAAGLESERNALATASDGQERMKLVAEKAELEDRKLLATHQVRLTTRRDLLKMDDAYLKALAEVQTKGITQRANELLDWHLTAAVQTQFDVERECFDISHLTGC